MDKRKTEREIISKIQSKPEKRFEKSGAQLADSSVGYEQLSTDTASAANVSSEKSVDPQCDTVPTVDGWRLKRFPKVDTLEKSSVYLEITQSATKRLQESVMDKRKTEREIISKKKLGLTEPNTGVSGQSKTSEVTFEQSKPEKRFEKSGAELADSSVDYEELSTDTASAANVSSEKSVDSQCDPVPTVDGWRLKRFPKVDTLEKSSVYLQITQSATKRLQESVMDKRKTEREIISKKKLGATEPNTVSGQSKTSEVTFEQSKPEKRFEKSGAQLADSSVGYEELSTDTASAANVSSEKSVDRQCDTVPTVDGWRLKRFPKVDTLEKSSVYQQITQGATKRLQESVSNISKAQTSSTLSVMKRKSVQKKLNDDYEQYVNYAKKVITYVKVKEINEDLFTMPTYYSLAHCVAEDLAMERGIAMQFSDRFKRIGELYMQRETQGGLAILEENERFIYYLITKKKSTGKPTMCTMWSSLKKMQKHIQEHQITRLAMPRIGCGLDRLKWEEVKAMLEFLFQDIDVAITVCNFQHHIPSTSIQKKCAMTDVAYPIINIACETIIVYFGSEDGFVTNDISTLNNKFNILSDYKLSKLRTQGSVVRTCQIGYILYGFIVRKSSKDVIDFTSLVACAEAVNNNHDIDKYMCVAIEAFDDKKDDLLLFKVCNVLRCVLLGVNLYICWPNSLKYKMLRSTRYY